MSNISSNIRKLILLPLVGVAILIIGLALWGLTTLYYGTLDQLIDAQRTTVTLQFNQELRNKAELMSVLAEQVIADDEFNSAWDSHDRVKLDQMSKPYFECFRNRYDISHLNFIKTDQTNFLRSHRPNSYGDKINRFVLGRAIQSGLVESGLELGTYGTFTLRTVVPWIVDDSLKGYIELGEEVDCIFEQIATHSNVGVVVTIDKRFLNREKWEEGIEMLGHKWQWGSVPYCAVVGQTVDFIPLELKEQSHSIGSHVDHESFLISNQGMTYNCISVVLSDAGDRAVGHLYILYDVTTISQLFWTSFWLALIVGLVLSGFVTAFVDKSLLRMQKEIERGERAFAEIDQQKKNLREIKQTNIKLSQAQRLAQIGYWELSLDGQQIWASDEVFDIYELEREGSIVPVTRIMKAIHPDDRSRVFQSFKFILGGGSKPGFDFRLVPRDGRSERVIYAQAMLRRSPEGVPIKVEGFVQDITDNIKTEAQKRQLDEKIKRADRMDSLGLMAGGVAHDLNNMLGPIVGYPELLLRKMPEDSPYRKQIQRIGSAAKDAVDVVKDLLTLARRGRYEMNLINLNRAVENYCDSANCVRLKEETPEVEMSLNLCENLGLINGSVSHLGQTIMNLIVNAFDAMPTGGKLTITTERLMLEELISGYTGIPKGEYVLLRVADTGMGIPKEELNRIFEPYYSKKKMGRSGSGLGLAVVYGIVKDHNGYYDVISEEGEFTEIILYFPLVSEPVDVSVDDAPDIGGHETILVVDDTLVQLEVSQMLLSSQGYEVHTAASGEEAIEFIKEHRVDVILLDMVMDNGLDGLDTYREIIKIKPGQKAIMVSGASVSERFLLAQELGAGPILKKPFTLKEVNKAVREALDVQNVPNIT